MFETDKDVLDWYERQPRALTRDFVDSIPWREVPNYALHRAFVPVLIYMRDVEYFTDIYYRELLRTPTGKDPVIRKFMDRWSVEENQHADLLNRFLNEAGITTHEKWQVEAKEKIPGAIQSMPIFCTGPLSHSENTSMAPTWPGERSTRLRPCNHTDAYRNLPAIQF